MKKRGFLLAACTVGVMLSGCGSRETAFSPSESCVYVAKDGALSSALVEQTGGISVDENELKQYLETAVIHFYEEKGAGALAQNQKNASSAVRELLVSSLSFVSPNAFRSSKEA